MNGILIALTIAFCSAAGTQDVAAQTGSNSDQDFKATTTTQESATEGSATKSLETQGSTTKDMQDNDAPGQTPTSPFEEKFWRYLSANNYKNWAPVPGQTGDFKDGKSPHGEQVKLYLNRVAAGHTIALPVGSVIVKENYDAAQTLNSVTVMYRSEGFNPTANDWYWVKYNADGSVAMTNNDQGDKKIAGRVKACIDCHRTAAGDDFAFFND